MMKMKIYYKCDIGGDVMMFFMMTYVDCHHHQPEVKGNHAISMGVRRVRQGRESLEYSLRQRFLFLPKQNKTSVCDR